MKGKFLTLLCAVIALTLTAAAQEAKRFEGYSFVIDADDTNACPVRFLPNEGGKNKVQVFLAGTDQKSPATGLTGCDESTVQGNTVSPNGIQKWCFQGSEEMYEIRLSNGAAYLWPAINKNTGYYNVMDFRPVRRVAGSPARYEPVTPSDYTATIRNAVAYIASRQGGTLIFPDGDYVVGTTDGNTRDPNYRAITLPSGITIEGASSNLSVTTTNMPNRTSASRIRLRNDRQSIFRIGGCTNQVTIRNIELLGNSNVLGEAKRSIDKTYGVEAVGKWDINPTSKAQTPNTSQFFRFENVVFQNFDNGIRVANVNEENCNSSNQNCNAWQFDYVKVDHGVFMNNKVGIYVNTFNSDWKITNSIFSYLAAVAPGTGIHIRRAASVLLEQTFGGGYDYNAAIGGTFLYIDTVGSMTIINSGSERGQRAIYTAPFGGISSMNLTVIGSTFGDKIELNGRFNYVSTGNWYGASNVVAQPQVNITSVGDRFCWDAEVLPGFCTNQSGGPEKNPGIRGGTVMFRTGRMGEGSGNNEIKRQPNYFGSDVQIAGGMLQMDPNITFRDLADFASGTGGRQPITDGAIVYCKDCRKSGSGTCTQGSAGSDGAFAKRINNQWRCD